MPDIAMASASLSQIHLQDEFDLDIGDRGSHGTMYIWCISVTLEFIEGLFCFIYYKVLSEITTFVLFIVQSRFLFLFFVVTYQIFFQSHLHVYYQVIILWMIFSIFYLIVISITFEVLKKFIIWWFCWLILIFWIKSCFFFRKTLK